MEIIYDRELFKEKLSGCSKEQLVELITDYAEQFVAFERYVLSEIYEPISSEDVYQEFLDNYIHSVEDASSASVDDLYSRGTIFIKSMEKLPDSVSKIMVYLNAINEFDRLLYEGIGWYGHGEWLVEQLTDECMNNIKSIVDKAISIDFMHDHKGVCPHVHIDLNHDKKSSRSITFG